MTAARAAKPTVALVRADESGIAEGTSTTVVDGPFGTPGGSRQGHAAGTVRLKIAVVVGALGAKSGQPIVIATPFPQR